MCALHLAMTVAKQETILVHMEVMKEGIHHTILLLQARYNLTAIPIWGDVKNFANIVEWIVLVLQLIISIMIWMQIVLPHQMPRFPIATNMNLTFGNVVTIWQSMQI